MACESDFVRGFSMMVDEALERMKKMLESNKAMQTLVSGEAGETVEKDM